MSAPSIVNSGNAYNYDDIWASLIITDPGSSPVTECGAVYALTSVNANPTIGGTGVTKVPAAGTTGRQDAYMRGLTPGAEYTFKLFATNGTGTTYFGAITGTLAPSPGTPYWEDVVISVFDDDQVTFAGHVYSENGSDVTHRGFVYALTSLNPDPEIGGADVIQLPKGDDYGRFSETLTLAPGSYTVRSYATNYWGTSYPESQDFEVPLPLLRTSFKLISAKPGPWSDPPDVMCLSKPVVETTPGGWDIMREKLLVPYSPYFEVGTRRDHMLDERAQPFAMMYAQDERVVGYKGQWPEVELTSIGFAREKPWSASIDGDTDGDFGGLGIYRANPTVTVVWFSETLQSTIDCIPWPCVPPETFGWPAMAYNQITIPGPSTRTQGWLLIKRNIVPVPAMYGTSKEIWRAAYANGTTNGGPSGTPELRTNANIHPRPTLCMVTDHYVYKPRYPAPSVPGAASND
jgi:hypothetical protein